MRIGRIGTDHIQVFIRPARGSIELLAAVDRLERLIDAGYGAIDVVVDAAPHDPIRLARPVPSADADEVHHPPRPAELVDACQPDGERIFVHIEVDRAFSGRGLGALMVRDVRR